MKRVIVVAALAASSLAACGGEDTTGDVEEQETLRVFAAASLTESFTELGKQFEKDNPGTKVVFEFGPSSGLAEQIGQGAPADVFASASPTNMQTVVDAGDAEGSEDFATNFAAVAMPPDNPAKITKLSDLAEPVVKVAVCQPQVPCGKVAAEVFQNAGITVTPVTEEVDVKSTLAKVTLGEADAAMVYVTDVNAQGDKVSSIEIPADVNASTTYPIAPLSASKNADEAQAFVDLVLSDEGMAVLKEAGFEGP